LSDPLEVLGETPVASDPCEGPLDHPAAGQDLEPLHVVVSLDDIHVLGGHFLERGQELAAPITAVGPNQL